MNNLGANRAVRAFAESAGSAETTLDQTHEPSHHTSQNTLTIHYVQDRPCNAKKLRLAACRVDLLPRAVLTGPLLQSLDLRERENFGATSSAHRELVEAAGLRDPVFAYFYAGRLNLRAMMAAPEVEPGAPGAEARYHLQLMARSQARTIVRSNIEDFISIERTVAPGIAQNLSTNCRQLQLAFDVLAAQKNFHTVYETALLQLRLGRPANARALLLEMIATHPRDQRPLSLLAQAQWMCGDRDAAIETARRAHEANPGSPASFFLAHALVVTGDFNGAAEAAECDAHQELLVSHLRNYPQFKPATDRSLTDAIIEDDSVQSLTNAARVWAGAGEVHLAMFALRSLATRILPASSIARELSSPLYDAIRQTPPFRYFLRSIGEDQATLDTLRLEVPKWFFNDSEADGEPAR